MLDRPREECGVLGICAPGQDVARMAFFGLFALQHRGQEAAGIAATDGTAIRIHKGLGLVAQAFDETALAPLTGPLAIAHTRYSTTGEPQLRNAQPFVLETRHGPVAVAHNGNLINASMLRRELLENGIGLSSSSDTEVLIMMLAGASGESWTERIKSCMARWRGAYCLTVLTREAVYAVRDPWGFRPLSFGRLPEGGWAAASETGALRTLGCSEIREVEPGQIARLTADEVEVTQGIKPAPRRALCVFEHVYFSRPDSRFDDLSVHAVRQRLGEELAREHPAEVDVVIPVPDSSVPAAIGYARELDLEYNDGFIKNRYIGRTFIQPSDALRRQGVAMKFLPLADNLKGRRVVMIDDSIVRGNTSGQLVTMLRQAGASEVHMRITCPPILHPCYMGVDMGTYDELIAHRLGPEQIGQAVGADSLAFLSLDGMMRAVGRPDGYCQACFTGDYPLDLSHDRLKTGFEGAIAG